MRHQVRHLDSQRDQERVAQRVEERSAQHPGVVALGERIGDGQHGLAGVAVDERLVELLDRFCPFDHTTGGDHLVQRGERVA